MPSLPSVVPTTNFPPIPILLLPLSSQLRSTIVLRNSLAVDRGSSGHVAPAWRLSVRHLTSKTLTKDFRVRAAVLKTGGNCPYNIWSESLWAVVCRLRFHYAVALLTISKEAGYRRERSCKCRPHQSHHSGTQIVCLTTQRGQQPLTFFRCHRPCLPACWARRLCCTYGGHLHCQRFTGTNWIALLAVNSAVHTLRLARPKPSISSISCKHLF